MIYNAFLKSMSPGCPGNSLLPAPETWVPLIDELEASAVASTPCHQRKSWFNPFNQWSPGPHDGALRHGSRRSRKAGPWANRRWAKSKRSAASWTLGSKVSKQALEKRPSKRLPAHQILETILCKALRKQPSWRPAGVCQDSPAKYGVERIEDWNSWNRRRAGKN